MPVTAQRLSHFALVVLPLGALILALWSQHQWHMQPCAWCVLQRLLFILIGTAGAVAYWHRWRRPALYVATLLGLLGIWVAWHQYSVAAQAFSCDLSLADNIMSRWTGLDAALPWLFGIYATCAQARVQLWGIEYSLWGLALFAILALLAIFTLRQGRK